MSLTELDIGIVIPDYADDLITLWENEPTLWCVLYLGSKEVARQPFKFVPPLRPEPGFRSRGTATFYGPLEYNNFKVDGLPRWTTPMVYEKIDHFKLYPRDILNFTVNFIFHGHHSYLG